MTIPLKLKINWRLIEEKWKKQTLAMHNANNSDETSNKLCSETTRRNTFRKSNKEATNSMT